MTIYILNFLTLPLYGFIFNRRTLCFIASLQMFLILAFRADTIGVDLPTYQTGFEYISGLSFEDMAVTLNFFHFADLPHLWGFESGWVVLNWLVSAFGFGFHGLLVVCAAINMAVCGWFISRYSKIPWLSFALISALSIYSFMFGILRQSLALSFVLLMTAAFDREKYKTAFFCFLLAFTIHRASLISLALLFLLWIHSQSKNKFVFAFAAWVPFVVLSGFIYNTLVTSVMVLLSNGYEDLNHELQANNLLLLLAGIAIGIILFYDFGTRCTKMESLSLWAVLAALYWETFGLFNDVLARSVAFYLFFVALAIPLVLASYKHRGIAQIGKLAVYILLLAFLVYQLSLDTSIVPYLSVLDE